MQIYLKRRLCVFLSGKNEFFKYHVRFNTVGGHHYFSKLKNIYLSIQYPDRFLRSKNYHEGLYIIYYSQTRVLN
jgi:hypothetical protein